MQKHLCELYSKHHLNHIIEYLDVHHIHLSQHYDCLCCQYLLKGGEAGHVEEGGNPDTEPETLV